VGESVQVDETKLAGILTEDEDQFILNNMTAILNTSEKPKDFTALAIVETKNKKAIGVNTDSYDSQANSAGQDNLGQILMAVLSFRRLKQELGTQWHGGLLLVDELDAALHPLAQNKLLDFLYVQAKDIGIQVIFTTHSLSLLEHLSKKTAFNSNTEINKYELIYLKKSNGPLEIIQNPQFEIIYYDLMATYDEALAKRIPVFSEDDEGRILIKKMLNKFLYRINILEASFGNDDLFKMLGSDYYHFCNFIFIIDGDVQETKIKACARKVGITDLKCVLKLPGGKRPEQVIWEYIDCMNHDHLFLKQAASKGISLTSLREQGPYSTKYNGFSDERDKFKNWFKDNGNMLETAIDFWCKDNKEVVDNFSNEFVVTFNWIASRNFIPRILFSPEDSN
jgi:predicted ATP-dependent endonuclease of OLD family